MTRTRPKTLGEIEAEKAAAKAAKIKPIKSPKQPKPVVEKKAIPSLRGKPKVISPEIPTPVLPEITHHSKERNEVIQLAAAEAFAIPYVPPTYHIPQQGLSPEQELAARELCRRRLLPFIQRFRPKYLAGWVHADICRRFERFLRQVEAGEEPRLLLMMPPRSGKQLADDTLVPTPQGWRTHGQLLPGDEVFHPSGKPVKVLAVSEKTPSNVRVTFSDGEVFYCHENHEWTLLNRMRGEWQTIETSHFLKPTRFGKQKQVLSEGRSIYLLPVAEPLQFSDTEFTMHPYVLGAWLGDGSSTKPCITGAKSDKAVIEKIVGLGYSVSTVCEHNTTGVLTTYFSGDGVTDVGLVPKRQGPVPGRMSQELRSMDLFGDKRIPPRYQTLTVELRLELLAGLIDTDGTTDKKSRMLFTTANHRLAVDVMQLCSGLSFRPYMQVVEPKLSSSGIQGKKQYYVVGFQPTCDIPVALERKRVTRTAKQRRVGLVSVERVESGKVGHCIRVDSPDGLYVVGKQLTTTHNSEISSRHYAAWVLGQHPDWEIIAASHTGSLTMSFSRYLRDLIRDPAYSAVFPDAVLDPSSQSVENWNLTKGGGYLAAGVGTGITGRGAHILLLDDLVKDIEAADSITIRDNTWEWYISTAYTRLAPGGGVLGLMCMTGDTLVLLADGSQRRLDAVRADDQIATYENGCLTTSRVAAMKSSGRDSIYKITTTSGKIVRANQRHPFLTVTPEGELAWTRVKNLTTGHRIVARSGNGGSGKASPVQPKDATSRLSAEACAAPTTTRKNGPTATAHDQTTTSPDAPLASSTVTESQGPTTTPCTLPKVESAPSVVTIETDSLRTGRTSSQWITVTIPDGCEDYSATTVMPGSDTLRLSRWHLPQQNISDFIAEQVASIEADGEEEVFDLQVDRTENFIANGMVSHNTWWHDDDWAGRIQNAMAAGEGDQFEVVRYPAINEKGDEYLLADDTIVEIPLGFTVPDGARRTRKHNTAIHPERYSTGAMLRIKRNAIAGGMKRTWDALYQQNPIPDEGNYFSKEMFRFYSTPPARNEMYVYQAWDFAITTDKTSDYTVCSTVGVDHRDSQYVLDVRRFKTSDGIQLAEMMVDMALQWGAESIGVEDGQIWKAIETQFLRACEEKRHFPAFEVLKPLTDKMVRANPLKGRMQAGKVYFDKNAHWWTDLQKEMLHFPAGKHDDQIDSLAWVTRLILTRSAPRDKRLEPKLKSWKDDLTRFMENGGGSHMAA